MRRTSSWLAEAGTKNMDHTWKVAVVPLTARAEDALRVLDEGGLRIALVVDEDGRLNGIVTDSEVRRALLRRVDFSSSVSAIMNFKPTTAHWKTPRVTVHAIMAKQSLLHMPLLDDEDRIVGLETIEDLHRAPVRDNWVFLMAGGFGTRLKPLTDDCPKPLLPVGGKPILETILESFIAAGFHRFYVSVHYLAERIKSHFGDGSQWGVTVKYVEEETPLGTGGALGLLPETDGLPVVVINGDVLTRLDFNALVDFHDAQDADMTLCVREYDVKVPFGVVEGKDSQVTDIVEKPVHRFLVNAGVYVIGPTILEELKPARRIDMPDLVKDCLARNGKVGMFPIHEYWIDIGIPEDFHKAQQDVVKWS